MQIKSCFIIILSLLLTACNEPKTTLKGAEFATLGSCLVALERKLGKLNTVTDTPQRVAGIQLDGMHWGCSQRQSGTKGVYWDGVYTVKISQP